MQASQASDAEWWELCPNFYTQRHTLGLRLLAITLRIQPGGLLSKELQSGEIGLKMELESVGVLVQTEANLEANHREVVGALLYEVTSMWWSSADFSRGVGSAGIRTQVLCDFFLQTSSIFFHQVEIKRVVFFSTSFRCLTKLSLLFARVQSGSCRQPGRDLWALAHARPIYDRRLNNQDENVTACSQCNCATFPFQIELGGRVNVVDQQALASETVMISRLLAHLWRWVGGWSVCWLIRKCWSSRRKLSGLISVIISGAGRQISDEAFAD